MDQIQIERTPGSTSDVTILTLTGPLTIATLFDFQTAVRQPDLKSTIIDFSGSALHGFRRFRRRPQPLGAHPTASARNSPSLRCPRKCACILEMTGVSQTSAFLSHRRRRGARIFERHEFIF